MSKKRGLPPHLLRRQTEAYPNRQAELLARRQVERNRVIAAQGVPNCKYCGCKKRVQRVYSGHTFAWGDSYFTVTECTGCGHYEKDGSPIGCECEYCKIRKVQEAFEKMS